jgi:hypothetical protein
MAPGLALFLLRLFAHLLVYRPAVKRLIGYAERNDLQSAGFQSMAKLERKLGIAMTLVLIAIAFLMVVKPRLWG